MKAFIYVFVLFFLLGCQINNLIGPVGVNYNDPLAQFIVDGVGPVRVDEETKKIDVLLPPGFNSDSLRITYQLGRPLTGRTGRPASGAAVYFQGQSPIRLCIQTFTGVGCERLYTIQVRYADPVRAVTLYPEALERAINSASLYQNIALLLTNQGTFVPGERRFRLRFINRKTGFTHIVDNADYSWTIPGMVFPNNSGRFFVSVGGQLPFEMVAGVYDMTLLISDKFSSGNWGTDQLVAIAQPFILTAGQPLLFEPGRTLLVTNALDMRVRNLTPTTPASIRLMSDFEPTRTIQGQYGSDTLLRFPLTGVAPGTYLAETSFNGRGPVRSLVAVGSASTRNFFSYVGNFASFARTSSEFAPLKEVQSGDSLEVRYEFADVVTGQLLENKQQNRYPEKVFLISSDNSQRVYPLKMGNKFNLAFLGLFYPFYPAWKLIIPKTVPKGEYQLVFEDILEKRSLPHYRKVVIL